MKNQKGFANIILFIIIVVLLGAAGYFAFVKKSAPTVQQPTSVEVSRVSKTNPSQVPIVSLRDEIASFINEKSKQKDVIEGGGGKFCYTGPPLNSIGADEKDSNSLPDLFVEDVKTETILMTGRNGKKVPTIFVYAKIKNNGKTVSNYFFTIYKWTYLGENQTYDDEIRMGNIFSGKYLGGQKDPSLERDKCESGYPWTPVKFASDLKKGDKVEIILDYNNRIKESNEFNNKFIYIIK